MGLAKDYNPIINVVEKISDCDEIVISRSQPTGIDADANIFFIAVANFEKARKIINDITNLGRTAARSVKEATTYNLFAEELGLLP